MVAESVASALLGPPCCWLNPGIPARKRRATTQLRERLPLQLLIARGVMVECLVLQAGVEVPVARHG